MIEFLIGVVTGAIAVVSVPSITDAAVRLRDWLVDVVSGPKE